MKSTYTLEIGIDVSKAKLDVCFDEQTVSTIPNTKKGIQKLFNLAKGKGPVRITCESTGSYSELLIKECLLAQIPISLANPTHVKNYIRSYGKLAKTDRIDAMFIRKYAIERNPKVLGTQWLERDELKQLHRRLNYLIAQRAKLKVSLDKYDNIEILHDIKEEIVRYNEKIKLYEDKIDHIISQHEEFNRISEVLEQTPGVGPQTSRTLIINLPELGKISRSSVAALGGLAPMHNDSGTHQGKRMVQGGRSQIRRIMYMAAVSSIRCNAHIKQYYLKLKSRGKCGKVAVLAIARKILIHLNSNLKNKFAEI